MLCLLQGTAAGEHFLLHAGHQLDASKTLADYSIQHQDTCELLLRLRCVCCTLQPTPCTTATPCTRLALPYSLAARSRLASHTSAPKGLIDLCLCCAC